MVPVLILPTTFFPLYTILWPQSSFKRARKEVYNNNKKTEVMSETITRTNKPCAENVNVDQ